MLNLILLLSIFQYPNDYTKCIPNQPQNVCVYIDVATQLTQKNGLPGKLQYLEGVKIKIGDTWRITDDHGRFVAMMYPSTVTSLTTDASELSVNKGTKKRPVIRKYIDKTFPFTVVQGNQRVLIILKVNTK